MDKIPETFATVCKIVGMSEEEINKSWISISEGVINSFVEWLIKEGDLSEERLKTLETLFIEVTSGKATQGDGLVDLVAPILNQDQKDKAITKFAALFVENLENFYRDLRGKMTMEQKQVTDSYTKAAYV